MRLVIPVASSSMYLKTHFDMQSRDGMEMLGKVKLLGKRGGGQEGVDQPFGLAGARLERGLPGESIMTLQPKTLGPLVLPFF